MKRVVIRHCPVWASIKERSARVADELRKQPEVEVQEVDGARGEFTVLVDGREVAHKTDDSLPTAAEVVTAVRSAGPAAAGAKG